MLAGVEHDKRVLEDYRLLHSRNMRCARDGIRWNLIDRCCRQDYSSFAPMLDAATSTGTQVIWSLCHYGWPDDVDLFSTQFVTRFAKYARGIATFVRERTDAIPFYAPMNEISFLAWAASRPIVYPFAEGRDNEIKDQLIRAVIAGCEAVWEVDRRARFVYPEPVIHVFPQPGNPETIARAAAINEAQYEAWDMIGGYKRPDLGGHPRYLDILGANYYHSNQWEDLTGRLRWEDEPRDPRWIPFHRILQQVWERYHKPLFVAETSHFGVGRARWIREIGQEVYTARQNGVPVEGVCLYPILDRFDWENRNHWHNSGLWDLEQTPEGLQRVLNQEYFEALREVQNLLASIGCR